MLVRTKLNTGFIIIAVMVVITGLLSVFFTDQVGERGLELGVYEAPLADAAMEIKLTATKAQLWLEEILGGDSSEDVAQVWELLDQTLWYADAIIQGGENVEGRFYPSSDETVIEQTRQVRKHIVEFRRVAEERYKSRTSRMGTGSGADQQFDDLYSRLVEDLDTVSNVLLKYRGRRCC